MRQRTVPLQPGTTPKWFTIDLGDLGLHVMRIPRWGVLAELMSVLNLSHTGRDPKQMEAGVLSFDADVTTEVRASMDASGAMIGTFWRHTHLELVADRHSYSSDPAGLRRFGDAVLDELDDAGYSTEAIGQLIADITPKLISGLFPRDDAEVAARAASFLHS